ncbi:serine hydrolase domain-containing protein [Brachybacterium avium]|nr:serine hydrolase domain-containing protein [Brachybacterium avium]
MMTDNADDPAPDAARRSAAELAATLHTAVEDSAFSGVIRVDHGGTTVLEQGYGLADRAYEIAMTPGHRLGVASISKGFTALAIGALIDDGALALDAPVRPLLGEDLPEVDDAVTVQHLLAHTSGIGDYLDESAAEITDHVLEVPVHTLVDTEDFLSVLDGHPQVSIPGDHFEYNNAGYVLLALLAQRVAGCDFHELVRTRVLAPAGMTATDYPRMDELGGDVARSYLEEEGLRTNALHLPVRGSGDGGAVTTAADLAAFWPALLEGRIVSPSTLEALTAPRVVVEDEEMRYGRGFWRGLDSELLILEGYDAGVSARTWHDPATGITASVLANHSDGAWPVVVATDGE